VLGNGPSGSPWAGGNGTGVAVTPNGPSVSAATALNARPDVVTADAARKARLSMFPSYIRRFSLGSMKTITPGKGHPEPDSRHARKNQPGSSGRTDGLRSPVGWAGVVGSSEMATGVVVGSAVIRRCRRRYGGGDRDGRYRP
jgi:hypothetical protein